MNFGRLRKACRSIHTRLLLVIVVAGIGISALSLAALAVHQLILGEAFHSSVAQYARYLAKDLGSPPDYGRAVELAGETGMVIHYFSPEATWSTSGHAAQPSVEKVLKQAAKGVTHGGDFHGHHYFIYRLDPDRRFVFQISGDPAGDARLLWVGPVLLFFVTLLLLGALFWIRRIMNPLRFLTAGVRKVGEGCLEQRVPVHGDDELGEVAAAFNQMAERLQHLLRAKDRMLLDVSHELRSPLTRMRLALEISAPAPLKESLVEELDEMDRMVTTILANARMQSGNLSLERVAVDLVSLIREAIGPLEDQPPGVCLRAEQDSVDAFLDPGKVKTVLRNVVGNAVKYSRETSSPVVVRAWAGEGANIVEIRDEGVGISEQDLPFVFEPFYRVDPSRSRDTGGFGLGLSLCKAIMEAHQGSIAIESAPGKGTTVRLQFPRS